MAKQTYKLRQKMKRLQAMVCLLVVALEILAQQEEVRITHFNEEDGFEQDIATCAIQDRYGYVWIATWNGLCRYNGYRFRSYRMRPGDRSPLRTNRIGTVRELANHDLECTTSDSLLFVFHRSDGRFEQQKGDYSKRPRPYKADASIVEQVKSLPQFADVYANVLLVDRQGGIWVDTHSGLYRIWFSNRPLKPVKFSDCAEEEVHALFTDKQGRTWVADKNGYVRVGNRFLTPDGRLSTAPVAFRQKVYCIFEDSRGDVWLGAKPDGLTRLTPKGTGQYALKRYTHDDADKNSLSSNNVYDIAEDGQQRLWIATYQGGLNMFDLRAHGDSFLHGGNGLANWPADEASNKVRCLHITPDGVLIAGTLNGLYTCLLKEKPQQMRFWHNSRRADDSQSLSYNWITDIESVGDHAVAIATNGGGLCLTSGSQLLSDRIPFHTLTSEHGLPSDVCLGLFCQHDDKLYIALQTSVSCLSLKDSTFTNFTRGTLGGGFKFLDTKPEADAQGNLLFGTTQGVLRVGARDMQKSNYRPPIVLEGGDEVSLSSDERSLTIRFAAIDFNINTPITYAYRIEGMNDQWIYITDNHITLPDIPAGTYRLHLRSTNGDGVWADNERLLTIRRRAAFHETPWAWLLYGLLIALVAGCVMKVVRYIRRLQNEIKDVRLTSEQRMEVMSERIRELLSIHEKIKPVGQQQESIENDEDHRFAESVKAFVSEHLQDADLSIQDLASELAVSRTILFARMKSVFGTSPNNYLLNRRIEHARTLLRQPGVSVADVAYRSGFSDPKYFSRCFKKLTGQTPSEFQKL